MSTALHPDELPCVCGEGLNSLWLSAEQHLDEGQRVLVQLLQLLGSIAYIQLRDVEKRLLFVVAKERRDSCQHHIGQNSNAPEHRNKAS